MPIFRRVGRPGLIGLAARTAVVAGTATAVSGAMRNSQANRAEAQYEQDQYAASQQQAQIDAAAQAAVAEARYGQPAAAPAAPAASVAPAFDLVGEIQKLVALKDAGVLSDDEFAAAKAKLLA